MKMKSPSAEPRHRRDALQAAEPFERARRPARPLLTLRRPALRLPRDAAVGPGRRESHINPAHGPRQSEDDERDERRLLRRRQERGRDGREQQVDGVRRLPVAQGGDDDGEGEEDEVRLVYEVARDEDVAGREGYQGGGRERAGGPYVAAQIEREPDGGDAEGGGHEPDGDCAEPRFAEEKRLQLRDRQREVVERGAVVVRGVVAVGALAVESREEEAVDALVVVHGLQAQRVEADEGGRGHDEEARGPPDARMDAEVIRMFRQSVGRLIRLAVA